LEKLFQRFASEEEGSVTIDWIVLTAGLVGLAVAIMASAGGATTDLATRTNDRIETYASS